MKHLRSVLVLLALLVSVNIVAKPKIRIIATGGTIAGVSQSATSSAYSAGQVGVQTLIDAVPQMLYLADISGEQLVNGSSSPSASTSCSTKKATTVWSSLTEPTPWKRLLTSSTSP